MQIKDVLQELLDEDLVNCEKCGVSNLYWSFKSEGAGKLQKQQGDLRDRQSSLQLRQTQVKARLKQEKLQREEKFQMEHTKENTDRTKLLQRLEQLKQTNGDRQMQLLNLQEKDPKNLQIIAQQLELYKSQIEIYVDNISMMLQYFTNDPVRPIQRLELMKELKIPEDFDE